MKFEKVFYKYRRHIGFAAVFILEALVVASIFVYIFKGSSTPLFFLKTISLATHCVVGVILIMLLLLFLISFVIL